MQYSVQILRMVESSGNNQFFVYAIDNTKDNKSVSSSIFNCNKLKHSCYQSKHFDFNNKEPIERATYDAIQLLKFFNLTKEDLILPKNLTDEELTIVNKTFVFWRF